jgi:hypothetical protein
MGILKRALVSKRFPPVKPSLSRRCASKERSERRLVDAFLRLDQRIDV